MMVHEILGFLDQVEPAKKVVFHHGGGHIGVGSILMTSTLTPDDTPMLVMTPTTNMSRTATVEQVRRTLAACHEDSEIMFDDRLIAYEVETTNEAIIFFVET